MKFFEWCSGAMSISEQSNNNLAAAIEVRVISVGWVTEALDLVAFNVGQI